MLVLPNALPLAWPPRRFYCFCLRRERGRQGCGGCGRFKLSFLFHRHLFFEIFELISGVDMGGLFGVDLAGDQQRLSDVPSCRVAEGRLGRKESAEIQAIDYIASLVKQDGSERVAIGYSVYTMRYVSIFHAADSLYKVGADFDVFFKSRHQIINTNHCPEGFSSYDNYRIVADYRDTHEERIAVPADTDFHTLRRVGAYRVMKHN